ncbi:MAG: D-glycero-alpha-D-manno-heptose-1,7-bisphosphate 7-phosphatase [Labedaea sp.]
MLFDRDGTLIEDVPYNGDPALVRPVPGAKSAVDSLRASGLRLGVITNQSAIGRGLLTVDQVEAVNARVDELLGPFPVWRVCPHQPAGDCRCRKPRPGMVLDACAALGVEPAETVVIGDIGADVDAAIAAGAHPVLVPNPVTEPAEIDRAPVVAPTLVSAVRLVVPA